MVLLAVNFDNLHQILQSLYTDMICLLYTSDAADD